MKTVFLIYRPVMDYEESETAYLICSTAERADEVRAEMVSFAHLLLARLESLYDEEGEILPDELYFAREESNSLKVGAAEWPYGIDLSGDLPWRNWTAYFDEMSIAIRELPLV